MTDLLAPRYKVVSDWPARKDFIVGEIITLDKPFSPQHRKYEITDCGGTRTYINSFFDMFPLQFRKLEWHEERTIMDLPDYIKWQSKGESDFSVFKVNNWYSSPNSFNIAGCDVDGGRLFIKDCQPATETEYLNYIKQKQ